MRKSALINIITKACCEASSQVVRDFNELAFLRANRKIEQFVQNARSRTLDILIDHLLKSNPGHGIIENNQTIKPSETKLSWALNPIDCTENFLHRLPFFGMCIALIDQTVEIESVVHYDTLAAAFYDPLRNELFWAEKNQGAFLNATKLSLITGSSHHMKLQQTHDEFVMPKMIAGHTTTANRNFGSSVLHMAYVAASRLDSTHEKIDDIANICTGKLLVMEAKGEIDVSKNLIIARNLHTSK